ncbi:phage tail protein [Serratia ficaria]|uniref:phage tail protein n=1 Tax=Serratia ficaria TaxID=61651 RepID=UPI002183195B|nr:phage tail protein [Serratia ficaria]CAI2419663.1 Phage tail fibre repeat [Serratia ficaria]
MSKYKAIITTAGAAKIAAATAGGTQLKINRMAVGDGNGTLPTPNPAQTKLVNEKYRAALNGLTIAKTVKNNIVAEMIIPADVGGFWLREMGLYDEAGTLIAVANMAESYKPKLAEGSGRTQTLRMILIVSSTEAIQVIAGGDTVLATKDFVADAIAAHEKTRNHPDASTTAKGLVQLSSATTSTDETKAATPKAVKVVSDASVKKAANLSDLADKAAARGNLALGSAAIKNVGSESGQVMGVGAFGLGMGSRHRDDAYCNLGEIYRVNNTSANAPGNGVYGVISLPCDGGPSTGYLSVSNAGAGFLGSSNSTSGIKWSRIYSTDNKPTAADVGAWSKSEADSRYAQRANNLSDLPDKAKARQALALKSAAQRDVGEASGQVLTADQAFGLGLSPAARRHALADIWGKGAFTGFTWAEVNDPDMPPIAQNGSSVGIINHTWQVSAGGEYFGMQIGWRQGRMSFRTKEAGKGIDGWFEFLHSGNGYTAKQTDAKYALRSLKINGKSLSGDVNLLAGDVNAWNKTEADGRYLMLTGGTVKKLVIKPDSTAPEGEALRVEGGAHTPLVVSRTNDQVNLSIGFQVAGKPLQRLGVGADDELHWGPEANQGSNPRIYTTAKPPTAQETGALIDADAMKKYAQRSFKINGKPLSGDVNLLAGDVNAWNKTEADGRYVKRAGDTITGGLTVNGAMTTKQGLRADGNVSTGGDLWVDNGAYFQGGDYIRKRGNLATENNTRTTNGLRVEGQGDLFADFYHLERIGQHHFFGIHVANGGGDGWYEFRNNGELHLGGNGPSLHIGNGTIVHPDGNLQGPVWGADTLIIGSAIASESPGKCPLTGHSGGTKTTEPV